MKKCLGHRFITSSGSHFFNKTDFEQCFFKFYLNAEIMYCREQLKLLEF